MNLMKPRLRFYHKVLQKRIKNKNASILICGGGQSDKLVFEKLGFNNVTISNFDTRMSKESYLPYFWKFENMEALSFEDNTFDYTVVHAAIHHCALPHKAITEMYRVAIEGILVFESRDSLIMRFLQLFGMAQTFEHAAVYNNNGSFGGVNNSEIPNYVYRWTEREVKKTIHTYAPYCEHEIYFDYGLDAPRASQLEKRSFQKMMISFLKPILYIFSKIFKKQQNLFAFFVIKPDISKTKLLPWLYYDKKLKLVKFDKIWMREKYQ